MLRRSMLMLVLAGSMTCLAFAGQQDQQKPTQSSKEDLTILEERLSSQFNAFQANLLQMAQRLERSPKPEDRQRAVLLKDAIKKTQELGTPNKFTTLIDILKSKNAISLNDAKEAMDRSKMVAEDIRTLLAILMSDNRDAQLKAEKDRIQRMIKMLDKAIQVQKVARAQNESGQLDRKALGKAQDKAKEAARDVAKAMDPRSGDPKEGQSKDGKSKDGQSKSGQPKDGQPKDGQSKEGQSKDGQSKEGNQPPEALPGKQQLQDAQDQQDSARKNIEKDKRDDASQNQDQAVKKMEEVRKRWEELLRQLREEELERLLAALQVRCERMLAIQIEVYESTQRVDKAIAQNPDKKPGRPEEQRSLQLADRETELTKQANSALQLLEAEGSAVAFVEAFLQVRDDSQHVTRRLGKVDVAAVTQTIEQDIIATLKEMVEALKKAQQDLQNKKQQQQQGGGAQQNNQNLIDILAELKMIRSMQIRVNNRTTTYGRQYQGEQAAVPDIQKELENLADRQKKILDVTNSIARGKNR
jgi:CRISPR/Cas system-associated endonuclease Cas3-HD